MFSFDPMYYLFLAPAMCLALWAQYKVKSAYAKASRIPAQARISGAEAAARILRSSGIDNVGIEMVQGHLSDHYDPRKKMLRLSPEVYSGHSLASLGIAAHEAGHAIQDKKRYAPLVLRNGIVPLASTGSNLSFILLFAGMMIGSMGLIMLGIALFSMVVVFQLVNLPVEFDASSRAKKTLVSTGLISPTEQREVGKVLSAAAMTYVAGTITAIMTLLYYLMRAGLLGGRDE